MQALDLARYQTLREGADVIEADGSGDKVLRLRDGTMFKLFRRKRLITSAAWYPYAKRFADNCLHLSERNIPCPHILTVYRIGDIQRDAVHYNPLPGRTLRQLLESNQAAAQLRAQFGRFVATLHQQGVYFRSLHLGNVVLTPEGELGLIDVADLKRFRRPLRKTLRLRNFKHMVRYAQDRAWLLEDEQTFIQAYAQAQTLCGNKEVAAALA